jgi:Fur family ferric uptake transcriptional regulator
VRIAIVNGVTATWEASALERLRAGGGRTGAARRAVVEFLGAQRCCHSAQEVHERIRSAGGHVGIASVYRTLDRLEELRLAQRVDLGDGVARFEPALPGGDHHHHLVCGDCGKVEPFSDPALEAALASVAGALHFDSSGHEVLLRGACDDCRTD